MSSFTDHLVVSPLPDGKHWVVRKEFYYYIDSEDGERITVPVGFITDFASIPRPFWFILPKWEKYGSAAVIHDYLYCTKEKSKSEADKLFLDGMKVLGVGEWERNSMYWSVRFFGLHSYIKKKDNKFIKVLEDTETVQKIEFIGERNEL